MGTSAASTRLIPDTEGIPLLIDATSTERREPLGDPQGLDHRQPGARAAARGGSCQKVLMFIMGCWIPSVADANDLRPWDRIAPES